MFSNEYKKAFHELNADEMKVVVDGIRAGHAELLSGGEWIAPSGGSAVFTIVYRVIDDKPDSIDWSCISPEFICMARARDGEVTLGTHKPEKHYCFDYYEFEEGDHAVVRYLEDSPCLIPSYKQGNLPWDESLVMRPGLEEDS